MLIIMGNFLALSSVVGKSHNQVAEALAKYTKSVDGGLEQVDGINSDTDNCCIIEEKDGNTSIFYPDGYLEWDDSSQFVSKELEATVFSFHIHDGDLWMYIMYYNGAIIDQFNPIPDYWDDSLSETEINEWSGDVDVVVKHVPDVKVTDIKNYMVRWDLDAEEIRAYPKDEFAQGEWQLVDFMNKLNLPYPIDEDGNPSGATYKMWTKQLKLVSVSKAVRQISDAKPWWKLW